MTTVSLTTLRLQGFTYGTFELQRMPMHMWDMWVWLLLLATIVILIVILAVYLSTHMGQRVSPSASPKPLPMATNSPAITLTEEAEKSAPKTTQLRKALELVRPTLTVDERRIFNEIIKAGGETLQSDLPQKADFPRRP